MRRLLPLLLAGGLLLAACSGPPPRRVRFERDYLPGRTYLTEGRIDSRRWMGRRPSADAPWEALADEGQTVTTRQRLSLGEAGETGVPARLEILGYGLDADDGARRVVLDGYVGLAEYRPEERRFANPRLEGALDSTALAAAVAAGAAAGDRAEVVGLSADEAGAFLASTWRLLASSLADSARTMAPGDFFSDERPQEERLGPWPVRWIERSTTTLDGIDGEGRAVFSILRELRPQAATPDSLRLVLDGEGRGRMVYDPVSRTVVEYSADTRLDIQLETADGGAWRASSTSQVALGTRAGDAP